VAFASYLGISNFCRHFLGGIVLHKRIAELALEFIYNWDLVMTERSSY